ANVGANHPENQSATSALSNIINAALAAVDITIGNVEVRPTDTSPQITSKQGKVILSKGSAGAWTLAAPVAGLPSAGRNDGQRLTVLATTAFAHTVTLPTNALNGSLHLLTWTAGLGNNVELLAQGGVWYKLAATGVTAS